MSQYSNPTARDIIALISQFVDFEKMTYKLLIGGSQNTNYLIDTGSGKYVLTICEEKSIEETEQLVLLLEHLAEQNFPSSIVIRSKKGKAIILWKGKPVIFKAYLNGTVIDHLPGSLLELCGRRLAQLHSIDVPEYIPPDYCLGIDQFSNVASYDPDSEFHHWLHDITRLVQAYLSPDLPKALIHSDIFISNVIVSPDGMDATIMDFEEACHYYRIFDIGMMIVGLCNHDRTIDLQEATSIMKGYQSKIALTAAELNSLQVFTAYAAAATAYWRHKQFNHVKYDELQKDRYTEMRDVADYVKGMSAEEFRTIL